MRLIGLWVLVCALGATTVRAAEPKPLVQLLNAVPDVPASAEEAARWFDKDGHLTQTAMLALKAEIEANRHASETTNLKDAAAAKTVTMQGLENAGIDPARMQTDAAYAKAMQERIKKMSPAEQMAFVQKMMQPQTQAALRDTVAMAGESPAVEAAVNVAKEWPKRQITRSTSHIALMKDADAAAQQELTKPYGVAPPKMEYDSIGCDNGCRAQWAAYGEKLWPFALAREAAALDVRRAALRKDRDVLTAMLREADAHLSATKFGTAAQSQIDRGYITGYHQALLAEIDQLLNETESFAKRASDVYNAGVERMFWAGTPKRTMKGGK